MTVLTDAGDNEPSGNLSREIDTGDFHVGRKADEVGANSA